MSMIKHRLPIIYNKREFETFRTLSQYQTAICLKLLVIHVDIVILY